MRYGNLINLADDFVSRNVSRFQLAQLNKKAERGEGELASLTRFERGQLKKLYENKREEVGV